MAYRHPDIPFEDLRKTKDIIRLLMHQLHLELAKGENLRDVHRILREIKHESGKLDDPLLVKAVHNMQYMIDHHWPLSIQTSVDVLEKLKSYFMFFDEKTIY
jgi:hypothetical protein